MKRLLTLAAMFLCCMTTTFAQFTGSGSGTQNDPYLILNPINLNQLRHFLNQEGVYFKLMANIDLTEYLEDEKPDQGWQPVGNSSSAAFKGILDGNGKTISGLWINRGSTDYVGLFGYTSGATIKNLTIVATTIIGKNTVGGISGYSEKSTFSEISFSGQLQGGSNVGGLIGNSGDNLTLAEDRLNVIISASGDNVGGLIGKNTGNCSVSKCHVNNSKISGNNYIGGICGNITSSTLLLCSVNSFITGVDYVGGISGMFNGNATNCSFVGNLNAHSYVGGIFGCSKSINFGNILSVSNCYAIGMISASGDEVGGIIGETSYYLSRPYTYSTNLSSSYFNGKIVANNYVGGIIGKAQCGSVTN